MSFSTSLLLGLLVSQGSPAKSIDLWTTKSAVEAGTERVDPDAEPEGAEDDIWEDLGELDDVPLAAPAGENPRLKPAKKRQTKRIDLDDEDLDEDVGITGGGTFDRGSEQELRDALTRMFSYLRVQDQLSADLEMRRVLQLKASLGIPNLDTAALGLLRVVQPYVEKKDEQSVQRWMDYAARLAPEVPTVHWARFESMILLGQFRVPALTRALLDWNRSRSGLTFGADRYLSWGWSLMFATVGTLVLLMVLLGLRYARYSIHDLAGRLPGFFKEQEVSIMLALFFGIPMLWFQAELAVVFLVLLLIAGYARPAERRFGYLACVVVAVIPWLTSFWTPVTQFEGSETQRLAYVLSAGFADAEANELEAKLTEDAPGAAFLNALAFRSTRKGDLPRAKSLYERALNADPSSVLAKNNLAVVHYYLGDAVEATKLFEDAGRNRSDAEPYLNLATLTLEKGDFEASESHLVQARAINSELADGYAGEATERVKERVLAEMRLSKDAMWEELQSELASGVSLSPGIWARLGGRMPPWLPTAFAVLAVLLARLIAQKKEALGLCVPCEKCGRSTERNAPAKYCGQCRSVFLESVATEPQVRAKKEAEVGRYQRRRRLLEEGLRLVGGLGHIWGGHPWLALVLVFVTAFAMTQSPLAQAWLVGRSPDPFGDAIRWSAIGLTVLVVAVVALIKKPVSEG